MTKEELAKVIGHAVVDEDYRNALKTDPENAVKQKEANLTPEELKFLKSELDHNDLHDYAKKVNVKYIGPNKNH